MMINWDMVHVLLLILQIILCSALITYIIVKWKNFNIYNPLSTNNPCPKCGADNMKARKVGSFD